MPGRRRLALVISLALMLTACGSGGGSDPEPTATGGGAVATTGATASTGSVTTGPTGSTAPGREPVLPKDGNFVAISLDRYAPMWEEPGKGEQPDFALDTYNDHDESVPLLVERATMRDGEAWYEVLLPIRPNGSSAWVRGSDMKIREREDRLEVDLSERMLWHFRGEDVVERFRVGIGTEQYPTTKGRFYVFVKVSYADPNQPYGIMALGLSGFSRVITDWPGGGRIAVHGTPYASDRSQAVSHGCVRVYNEDMEHLTDIPLGTPVDIHA